MKFRAAEWLVGALLVGCGASPPPGPAPSAAARGTGAQAPAATAPPDPLAASAPAPSGSANGQDPAQPEVAAPPPLAPPTEFELDDWAHRRGLTLELRVDGCEPARLGKDPEAMLLCRRSEHRKDDWIVRFQGLYVVRGGRVVRSWEAPLSAEPLVAEAEQARPLVQLELAVGEDAATVTVRDSEPSCAAALAQVRELSADDAAAARPVEALRKLVCAGVGKYRLQGDTLVRAR